MEHVDNDIHEIQECPSRSLEPFDVVGVPVRPLHGFEYALGQRSNVRVGGSGCNHKKVRRVADLAQVQDDNISGLVRVERFEDEGQAPTSIGLYPIVAACSGNRSRRPAEGGQSSIW